MQDFRKVEAWKRAHELVLATYRETKDMPRDEVFGVTMQLRRGATAIATRIAEGTGKASNEEFAVDLKRAAVACNELEYLVLLAHDLGYWTDDLTKRMTDKIVEARMVIFGLLRSF